MSTHRMHSYNVSNLKFDKYPESQRYKVIRNRIINIRDLSLQNQLDAFIEATSPQILSITLRPTLPNHQSILNRGQRRQVSEANLEGL